MANTLKRLGSLAVAILMVVSLLPLNALQVFAADEYTEVATEEALNTAISEGKTHIKLTAGFTTTAAINIPADKTVTLDFNGNKITMDNGNYRIINDGTLTLQNTATTDGGITSNVNQITNNGTLTILSGTYTASSSVGRKIIQSTAGTVNIRGGSLKATMTASSSESNAFTVEVQGGVLNVYDGANIASVCNNARATYGIYVSKAATANIYGGKITANNTGSASAYAFGTAGVAAVVNISGGEFEATTVSGGAHGVQLGAHADAEMTISGASIKATSTSGTAYGINIASNADSKLTIPSDAKQVTVEATSETNNAWGISTSAPAEILTDKITVTAKTSYNNTVTDTYRYAYAVRSSRNITITGGTYTATSVKNASRSRAAGFKNERVSAGNNGKANISGGTFSGYSYSGAGWGFWGTYATDVKLSGDVRFIGSQYSIQIDSGSGNVVDGGYYEGALQNLSTEKISIVSGQFKGPYGVGVADVANLASTTEYDQDDEGNMVAAGTVEPRFEVTSNGTTTQYTSLYKMVNAVNADTTGNAKIKLLRDVAWGRAFSYETTMDVDLNGHTWKHSVGTPFQSNQVGTENVISRIYNGKIINTGSGGGVYVYQGSLQLKDLFIYTASAMPVNYYIASGTAELNANNLIEDCTLITNRYYVFSYRSGNQQTNVEMTFKNTNLVSLYHNNGGDDIFYNGKSTTTGKYILDENVDLYVIREEAVIAESANTASTPVEGAVHDRLAAAQYDEINEFLALVSNEVGFKDGDLVGTSGGIFRPTPELYKWTTAHTFEYVSDGNATCDTDGTKSATCSGTFSGVACTEQSTVTDAGTAGHKGEAKWNTTATTHEKVYAECGHVIEAAAAHQWSEGECTVCAYECDHEGFVVTDAAVAPSCTEDGKTEGSHCSNCGYVIVAQQVDPKLDHDWDEGVITKPATETENGVKTYTCQRSNCGETKTEEIPAISHKWDEGKITTEATCTTDGVKTFTCTGEGCACGATYTEPVPKHTQEFTAATEPGCTTAGNTAYYTCSCGKYYADSDCANEIAANSWIVDALDHDFRNYTSNNDATCYQDGTETATCEREGCNEKHTRTDEGTKLPTVAMIGEARYPTLIAAITACKSNETIVLTADVTLTEALPISGGVVRTLDLAGHTIDAGAYSIITAGKLTIMDSSEGETGTITGSKNPMIESKTGADTSIPVELIVNGGNIIGTGGCTIKLSAGTATFNGGTVQGTVYAVKVEAAAAATFNGGNFAANSVAAVYNLGNTTINGGEFTMLTGATNAHTVDNSGTMTITGGTITTYPDTPGSNVYAIYANKGQLTINETTGTLTVTATTKNGLRVDAIRHNDGTTTIAAGSFTGTNNGGGSEVYAFRSNSKGTLTISGGTFKGSSGAGNVAGKTNLNGGYFTNRIYMNSGADITVNGAEIDLTNTSSLEPFGKSETLTNWKVAVTSGVFKVKSGKTIKMVANTTAANESYCTDSAIAYIENGTNFFAVTRAVNDGKTTGMVGILNNYCTDGNAKITLLKDFTDTDANRFKTTFELDMNGKTWTQASSNALDVQAAGSSKKLLRIYNGTFLCGQTIDTTKSNGTVTVRTSAGSLQMEDVLIYSTHCAPVGYYVINGSDELNANNWIKNCTLISNFYYVFSFHNTTKQQNVKMTFENTDLINVSEGLGKELFYANNKESSATVTLGENVNLYSLGTANTSRVTVSGTVHDRVAGVKLDMTNLDGYNLEQALQNTLGKSVAGTSFTDGGTVFMNKTTALTWKSNPTLNYWTTNHTYGDATCTKAPTCSCGAVNGEIDAAAHTGTEEWIKTATTHKKAWTCCQVVTVEEAAHSWENGTCTVCTYGCEHTTTEPIEGKAPTCTETGLTDGAKCAACGTVTKAQEEIKATDHTYTYTPNGDRKTHTVGCEKGDYTATGDCVDEDNNKLCDLCEQKLMDPVAVDQKGNEYETFQEAVDSGDLRQITLLKDVVLTERITVNGTLGIVLNGHSITGAVEDQYGMFYVRKGAELNVDGEGTMANTAGYVIGNYGSVHVFEGVTINGSDAGIYNFYYAADYYGSAVVNGNVNIIWNCGILNANEGAQIAFLDNSGFASVGNTVAELYARDGADAPLVPNAGVIQVEDISVVTVPDDYKLVYLGDPGYKVVAKVYVAEANGTKYESLAEAVDAAEAGSTVTLLADTTGAGVVINKNITIDFGGYTYTVNQGVGSNGTATLGLQILKGNAVTLKNGTLAATNDVVEGSKQIKMLIQNYADLTLTDMTLDGTGSDAMLYVLSNNCGNSALTGNTNILAGDAVAFDVYDYSAAGYTVPSVQVSTTGKISGAIEVSETATLAISGGTYTVELAEQWCAKGFIPTENEDGTYGVKEGVYVAQAGQKKYESLQEAVDAAEAGSTVTLLANATGAGVVINKNITIDFGGYTYTVNQGVGSNGTATLGLQILKGNAVTLKNGTLAATNDVVEGSKQIKMLIQNYADLTLTDMTLDGTGSDAMLYVLSNNCGNSALTGNTNILAGDAVAFDVYDYSAAGYTVPTVQVSTTGKISGKIEVSETATLAISGGTYTVELAEQWCAKGFIPTENEDGTYGVKEGVYVAQAGQKKYESLQEAVDAAEAGSTVTLLADTTGAGVVINKNITIDFGGYTYTVNQGVGSNGTATLGLQNLKGNAVTLKNGTLAATNEVVEGSKQIKMLIQNYADLTLTDMTLDGTGSDAMLYVLSNNCGNSALTGNTNILAGDAVAFDVYDYSAAGYTVPTVQVSTTGKISGKIEVSETATLAISGGTYTVELAEQWCAKGFIPTENEDGTYGVKEGVYVAQAGQKKYESLEEAVAVGGTVTLLTDVELTAPIVAPGVTIDLNGKTLKGLVAATLSINGGTYITAEDYKMAGPEADYYKTTDAVLTIAANGDIIIVSGTMEQVPNVWWTTDGQKLTIAEDATFVVPAGKQMNVNGTTVTVLGTVTGEGTINLYSTTATITCAAADLNVITTVAGKKVAYIGGVYQVIDQDVTAWVDDLGGYADLQDALEAAEENGGTVTLLEDQDLKSHTLVSEGVVLDLNGYDLTTSKTFTVYGDVIDGAAGGNSLVKASKIHISGTKSYLPLFDTDANGYRFFQYKLDTYEYYPDYDLQENSVDFYLYLDFKNADGYKLLANNVAGEAEMHAAIKWGKTLGTIDYTFSSDVLKKYGEAAAASVEKDGTNSAYIMLRIYGVASLNSGDQVTFTPVLETQVGMSVEGEHTEVCTVP